MGLIEVATVVIAGALVVLLFVIVPAIAEIRKTAAALRSLITHTETELIPTIRELQETLADLKTVTGGVAEKVDDVKLFMDAVGGAGRNIRAINSVVGGVANLVTGSSAWVVGAKVAGKYLLEKITKKRG